MLQREGTGWEKTESGDIRCGFAEASGGGSLRLRESRLPLLYMEGSLREALKPLAAAKL